MRDNIFTLFLSFNGSRSHFYTIETFVNTHTKKKPKYKHYTNTSTNTQQNTTRTFLQSNSNAQTLT